MAPVLNLPSGYCLCTLRWDGPALPNGAVSTFGVRMNGAITSPGTVAGLVAANVIGSFWLAGNGWSSSMTLRDIVVKAGPLEDGPTAVGAINAAGGTSGSDSYSPNAALLVKKLTAFGGKRGSGRMYLPPLTEGVVDVGGNIQAAVVSTIQGRLNTFLNDCTTDDVPLYLLHRYDPALGESPMVPTLVTQLLLQGKLATQRRRLRR